MKMKVEERMPSMLSLFGIILTLSVITWSMQGGEFAPIMDCDETFNYLEAAHYRLHGTGLQTWEYASQYGLRSWFYIELHLLPLRFVRFVFPFIIMSKRVELLFLRSMLLIVSCLAEAFLAQSVGLLAHNQRASFLTALLLGANTGLGHARRSFLPSSTCMVCFTIAQAFWMRNRIVPALFAGSFSVLVSWPFSALVFVPMGFTLLFRNPKQVVMVIAVSLFAFLLIPSAVDSIWFYKKPVSPTIQMILYNALGQSGGGAHLYGVETWTYYGKNWLLNHNIVFPLSLLGLVAFKNVAWFHGSPFLLTLVLFQCMAHKEERFLFLLFPSMCWSAAFAIHKLRWRFLLPLLMLHFGLCVSRNLALSRLEASSLVFAHFPSTVQEKHVVLCLGREWHRFPSSFWLPQDMDVQWTRSDFHGILPQPFARMDQNGLARFVPHMNDLNKEEPSRFSHGISHCDFVVDVELEYTGEDELQPFGNDEKEWERVFCANFGDVQATRQPYRSFAWVLDKWKNTEVNSYCLFGRRKQS